MNEVRYDAMTLGNHEPDFGMEFSGRGSVRRGSMYSQPTS
jgi:hypothetical protein